MKTKNFHIEIKGCDDLEVIEITPRFILRVLRKLCRMGVNSHPFVLAILLVNGSLCHSSVPGIIIALFQAIDCPQDSQMFFALQRAKNGGHSVSLHEYTDVRQVSLALSGCYRVYRVKMCALYFNII